MGKTDKKEKAIDKRSIKASRMSVVQVIEGGPLFMVHSHDSGKDYQVYHEDGNHPTCECPDFKHRHDKTDNFRCAHIRSVELWRVKRVLGLEDILIVDKKDLA
jgi:hypothetical protein